MKAHLEQMKEELAAGTAQLLDVREFNEWQEGHLKQALFAPLSNLEAGDEPDDVDLELKTYLHCRSGQRVHMAAPLLEDLGINEVIPLDEGFVELVTEGFEA
ncbi:Hydroxyacylglutathione hydrolase [Lentisphaera araneosa HTCC2155]|jgi:phage shock protein E|uniref:Hydroxyacylglutathione hydrolase n=1 Tax=Lentisphaera araneosa HTCC2155 TaxID=313628 RepID=A6DGY7_9BACT|nr:rhodanese-like domain-containing protein [Lentisphaera araneosa]EDM28870.1 Hydroxyacylglutathione hydrolase [Lentisphaera araneosa HTCC2155]